MLLAPVISALAFVVGILNNQMPALTASLPEFDQLVLYWPVPWVPYEPVLTALAAGLGATVVPLAVKFARWLYGMAPVVQ